MNEKINDLKVTLQRREDRVVFNEIFNEDLYHLKELLGNLSGEDIVLDVGAHIGLYSLAICQRVKKVIAIEPQNENFSILQSHISENNIKNIIAYPKALCSKDGKKIFYESYLSSARHSLITHPFLNFNGIFSKSTEVETISLATLFEKEGIDSCKLMKIDIEGGEYELFYESDIEILKKIAMYQIQYHQIEKHKGKDLAIFFASLGFETLLTTPRTLKYGPLEIQEGSLLVYDLNRILT